jgi:hypothetical protein
VPPDELSTGEALSLYLIETIPLLDPESETDAPDLLTLLESILGVARSLCNARPASAARPLRTVGGCRNEHPRRDVQRERDAPR